MDYENTNTINDWGNWKNTIAKAVDLGQIVGLSDETISKVGTKIGNILNASVDPENGEQRLLKELWSVADDEDRQTLSKLIVKMVQSDDHE
ncbi:DUF3243 domain-containing protein [Defluviitalea saccharophila]|uniref:DUF3243 domain-containing protein n=1 Tax=Defluviitalea saccharophila TaxID=879970 RepID=A0ABZ2Y7E3_9FIRM|nr:DUF3243 domain-containing protein [Candidatus Epulonipiscium sp.]